MDLFLANGFHFDPPRRPSSLKFFAEPQERAADGGIIEASDDGEMLDDGAEWVGPFPETDRYGERFVRCPDCGIEVLVGDTVMASHRPACRVD